MLINELFGIELPIIQAPMAGVQDERLALAVSEAGGLGSVPCALMSAADLDRRLCDSVTPTRRVVNLNFFAHEMAPVDARHLAEWRDQFASDDVAWGVDRTQVSQPALRLPFDAAMAEVVERHRPAVVSFHFGLPPADLLTRVRESGAKIISTATTLEEGLWLEARGVDAVIAQGSEAGGHRGMFLSQDVATQMGTFALVPQLVKALRVPVIAAGGIADAAGVRAAMALGASGVQVGTAYLLCDEASTSTVHRQALKGPHAHVTAITNVFSGKPARGIVNRMMRDLGFMNSHACAFPYAAAASAPLRVKAEHDGCDDYTPLWAGQNTTGCKEVPAAELTRALMQH